MPKKSDVSLRKSSVSKSATKLKILHRRRTNILGSAELIKTFDQEFDPAQRDQIKIRIQCLDTLWREYEEVQNEIEVLEDEEPEFCEERSAFQTMYFELKASLQAKLPPPPPPLNPPNNQPMQSQGFVPPVSHVRLPEIKLKEFSGNVDDWVSFHDLYLSLIHSNQQLTAVQKMHYLKATLSGEAARIISSLEVSANNYLVAWNLLKERFENPGMLIKRHMSGLLSIASLKKESAQGLTELADEFDRHVQLLNKLENVESHWNSFLVERLSSCLDSLSLREWETQISEGDDRPTYQELIEFIHKRSRMLQTLKLSQANNTQHEMKPHKSRLATAHVSSEHIQKCPCCKQAHLLFQCEQFKSLTPSQRFEFVKKHGLCINCLKGTHLARDCSSGSCKTCAKKHHSLLHLPPVTGRPANSLIVSVASQPTSPSDQQNSSQSDSASPAVSNSVVVGLPVSSPPTVSSCRQSSVNPQSLSDKVAPFSPSVCSLGSDNNSPLLNPWQKPETALLGHQSTVLLSTAVIKVKDVDGNFHCARALLDSGSQPSFLTEALCQKLRLKRTKINSPVSGIGQSVVNVRYGVTLHLASRYGNHQYSMNCLVLPKLTVALPRQHIDVSKWRIPRHLPLADPRFNISQGVDIIIGAELFFALMEGEQIVLASQYPILQKTVFGYIVCGKVTECAAESSVQTSHICTDETLDAQLERFWQSESIDDGKALSSEEKYCEEHFLRTHERDADGRYTVRLPLREEMVPFLGESNTLALRRFLAMEKKFVADENLHQEYRKFMEDFERLGHMEVSSREQCGPQFFLPHHAIQRPESSTTKTRVVFDGSCRSTTQLSLNDVLYTGPTVQPPLYYTVVNFRMPRYAVTADVAMMFRQIWVHEDDRKYQQIFWRSDPSEPMRTYRLKTVAYGLASSPYQATRVLNQLATDEGSRFPLAVPIVRKGVYVDDVLTGHDDQTTLAESCNQLTQLLNCGGLTLRKWASNDATVLEGVPLELRETSPQLDLDRSPAIKALGLLWFPNVDTFKFKIPELPERGSFTKRIIVSEMSSLFDPLGLLGPVIVNAKMFVQTLWARKYTWDEELPMELNRWWDKYRSEINLLENFEVSRRVIMNNQRQYTLHCFVDASQRGYGCCVYVVSPDDSGKLHCRLLTAKSRVAPLRSQNVPRLELDAALLGSQVVDQLRQHTEFNGSVTFWSDSTIVLHWIRSRSWTWKVYVSNRVAEIQRLTNDCDWRHIPTHMNPADSISRGMLASQFLQDEMWIHGPSFMTNPTERPEVIVPDSGIQDLEAIEEELRPQVCLSAIDVASSIFNKFSELSKLIRTTALCFRFYNNCRSSKDKRNIEPLASSECELALKSLIRLAQQISFPMEVKAFLRNKEDPTKYKNPGSKSPLKNLNLLMDKFGLLRIDGRLKNMNAPFDTRFPILLPAGHTLSRLIARSIHLQTLHGGPSLLLATIRQRFWPLQGRQLARSIVHKCVTCSRCRPRLGQQIMAPLPSVRIKPARPFSYSGMDYCGPFFVRPLNGRGASLKIYVGLFVCMVVKAVHLEVIADLTSVACINAVKRVVARRGRIIELYCDNATAFVGANRELQASRKEFQRQLQGTPWKNYCLENGITFHFIPARSPHFGGLWEAGIKSFKYHFRRVMGNRAFTMDQLLTVVSQIESVLNSRPLAPLSDSPDDLSALTPGHFLIGEPPFSIPEPCLSDLNPNRLTRLQEMKRSVQDLWRRWSRDYLHQLQQRLKWKKATADVRTGQLVLIKQDSLPSLQWPLGRIIETFTGSDGHVRVVVVRSATGTYKRAVTEISLLPIDSDDEVSNLDDAAGYNQGPENSGQDAGNA